MSSPLPGLAMRAAWRLAREGQAIYGGPIRAYIAEALRIAWAELKANPVQREASAIIAEMRARRPAPPARLAFVTHLSRTVGHDLIARAGVLAHRRYAGLAGL